MRLHLVDQIVVLQNSSHYYCLYGNQTVKQMLEIALHHSPAEKINNTVICCKYAKQKFYMHKMYH